MTAVILLTNDFYHMSAQLTTCTTNTQVLGQVLRKADGSEINVDIEGHSKLTYTLGGKIEKRKIERENIFGVFLGGGGFLGQVFTTVISPLNLFTFK